MKRYAIIVAGGSGSRMKSELPKQFIDLCDKPLLMHTIQVFYDFYPECNIIVVLPETQMAYWKNQCVKHDFALAHQLVAGGETRFHSVLNGLRMVRDTGIIYIHDGVRPLVSHDTLQRCSEMAAENGNAIPVLPVNESLRMYDGKQNKAVDRNLYFSVQTPQTFRSEQIIESFGQAYHPSFTDDASVAERAGFKINMVEGNRENIKITTPEDLIVAEAFLKRSINNSDQ